MGNNGSFTNGIKTSLVVQWLGPHAFTARAKFKPWSWELRSHKLYRVARKKKQTASSTLSVTILMSTSHSRIRRLECFSVEAGATCVPDSLFGCIWL